jgi:UDPglucose 6-dehydrogenase
MREKLKQHRPNLTFPILSNPEFLAAGTAINDLLFPDRVLIGSSPSFPEAAKALAGLYSWVPREKIVETNIFSSELAKLVANSMLAQRISSINSISAICERTGAAIGEISKAVGLDPRIGGKYLKAGIGFGGSCFRKDVLSLCYLAESLNLPEVAEYWEGVLRVNEWQRERFVKRVVRCLNGTLVGKKISVLGYAFKRDTSDTRESPALEFIKQLLEDGPREIAIFDPFCETGFVREEIGRILGGESLKVNGGWVEVYADVYQACEGSIAVCVLTDCEEFRSTPQAPPTSSSPPASTQSKDPRPFPSREPTEMEILALQKHLISVNNHPDPLNRFEEEPQCAEGCASCDLERKKIEARDKKGEKVDWSRIAYHLATPKWVFDGRNVLDRGEMEKLGVRLESIGRVGWGGLGA